MLAAARPFQLAARRAQLALLLVQPGAGLLELAQVGNRQQRASAPERLDQRQARRDGLSSRALQLQLGAVTPAYAERPEILQRVGGDEAREIFADKRLGPGAQHRAKRRVGPHDRILGVELQLAQGRSVKQTVSTPRGAGP